MSMSRCQACAHLAIREKMKTVGYVLRVDVDGDQREEKNCKVYVKGRCRCHFPVQTADYWQTGRRKKTVVYVLRVDIDVSLEGGGK